MLDNKVDTCSTDGLQTHRKRKQEGEKKSLDMECTLVEYSPFDENVNYFGRHFL
jgi:hypothetical protein